MHRRTDGHIGSQASKQAGKQAGGREQVDGQVHERSGMGGTRGEEIQGEEVSVGQGKRTRCMERREGGIQWKRERK